MQGRDLKNLRTELKITQQVLADWLNIDVGTVSRWERGVLPISTKTEKAIMSINKNNIKIVIDK